ncbi:MAG: hypothetical protein V1773_16970 [bacterium]
MNLFKINYLSFNFSLLKFSGIKQIVVFQLTQGSVRVYGLKLSSCASKTPLIKRCFDSVFSETYTYSNDLDSIIDKVKNGLSKNNFDNYISVLTLQNYRAAILIAQNDIEDIELWILENTQGIFPKGRLKNDFQSDYKLINKSVNNSTYLFSIVRKNEIESLIHSKFLKQFNIIAITPDFLSAAQWIDKVDGILAVNLSPNRIDYLLYNDGSTKYNQALYQTDNDNIESAEKFSASIQEILLEVERITQKKINNILIYGSSEINSSTLSEIENKFKDVKINVGFSKYKPDEISNLFLANSIYDDSKFMNFLPPEELEKRTEPIQKNLIQRLFFVLGGILIFWLLFLYMGETLTSKSIAEYEEAFYGKEQKETLIEKTQNENVELYNYLKQLSVKKNSDSTFSNILFSFSNTFNGESKISKLKFQNNKGTISIVIEGYAKGEETIVNILKYLESTQLFNNIQLLSSETITDQKALEVSDNKASNISKYIILVESDDT